jgi:hypothetical protein
MIVLLMICLSGTPCLFADEEVKISILAVNPSEVASLKSPIAHYLPAEIKPNDVLDPAGMEVKFDKNRQSYYLSQEVDLRPKETKKITVLVRNVWQISAEDLGVLREELGGRMQALEGTKYEESSRALQQLVGEKIDTIENSQKEAIEQGASLKRRMELYRANVKKLEQIQNEIVSLDSMRKIEEETDGGLLTVRFQISAENPSDATREMTVRSFFPPEITADDVIDRMDFDLIYDDVGRRFGVAKQETFGPGENKKYMMTLRNIWHIPQSELNHIKKNADYMSSVFKGSPFEAYAQQNLDVVYQNLTQIAELQTSIADSTAIEEHQRAFALNSQRLVLVRRKMQELHDLMIDVESSKEKNLVQDTLEQWMSQLAMLRDLLLRKMGYRPDRPTTWIIIFGICAFLAALSVGFYLTWIKQIEKERKLQKRGE